MVALLAAGWLAPAAAAATHDTTLISRVGLGGAKANGESAAPSVSADGRYVAYESSATNLHPDDTEPGLDVFRRDRQTGATVLVSRTDDDANVPGWAAAPSISADGTKVAFHTLAALDPADDDASSDVYVRDIAAGTTALVSRATGAGGADADGYAAYPSLSADGLHVAFTSDADNLGGADDKGVDDVFVRDLATNATELVSRAAAGANGGSANASISGDGQRVAFDSTATNLSATDADPEPDVFVRDRAAATTKLLSAGSSENGFGRGGLAVDPAISADGAFVAFETLSPWIDPFDIFSGFRVDTEIDVVRVQVATGGSTSISRPDGFVGDPADYHSGEAAISADGRHVAFRSWATNLDPADGDIRPDVYVRDTVSAETTLVSRASGADGPKADDDARVPAISGDGRLVAFQSAAANLVPADLDRATDVFARALVPATPVLTDVDPDSPANDNAPRIKGEAQPGMTIKLYTGGACTGTPAATGTSAQLTGAGIQVSVPDDSSTRFRATATDVDGGVSPCSPSGITYVEVSSTPRPTFTDTDPDSPGSDNAPRIKGSAAAGSTVDLYTNDACSGPPVVSGTAAAFASPGLQITVANNSTTTVYGKATAPGDAPSPCSVSSITYVEDSAASVPTVTDSDPLSPANANTPRIMGTAEKGATVDLYTTADCTGPPAATGTAAAFGDQGLQVTVADDTTTRFRATATDKAGNVSVCSTTYVRYIERSSLPAMGPSYKVTTSSDAINDGCTTAHCTLREAIEASNADPQRNRISFTRTSTPVKMIPEGPLPAITDPAVLDGESASFKPRDGTPDVVIDLSRGPGGTYQTIPQEEYAGFVFSRLFQSAPPPPRAARYDGLVVEAPNSIVSGMGVSGVDGNGFVIRDAPNTVLRRSSTLFQTYWYTLGGVDPPTSQIQIVQRNLHDGVRVERSPNAVIGGEPPPEVNVLTYNQGNGVRIDGASPGTLVDGNVIGAVPAGFGGTDSAGKGDGLGAAGNNGSGVLVDGGADSDVRIGEDGAGRNVFTGNLRAGVELRGGGNVVEDNWIGPSPLGRFGERSNGAGVLSTGAGTNQIGRPDAGNVISGNRFTGVAVLQESRASRATRVQANQIGPAPDPSQTLANEVGVIVRRTDGVLVGGTAAEANVIRGNRGDGIQIDEARVDVQRSSTTDNGGQGIDVLPDGPQVNDSGDVSAPQNRPQIDSATTAAGGTEIEGHVDTAPGRSVRVEVYGQPACDLTGVGEGLDLLGTVTTTNGSFTLSDPDQVPDGLNITATATSAVAGTSEHSPCVEAVQDPPPPIRVVNTTSDHAPDGACDAAPDCTLREAIITANGAAGTDKIHFAIPGSGIPTIAPTSPLPVITGPTRIEGSTQRPATPAGTPDVEISGGSAGAGVTGLHVTGGNSHLDGLVVQGFGGDGLRFEAADASSLSGSWVGLSKSGAAAGNGGDGIELLGARVVRVQDATVSANAGAGIAVRTRPFPNQRTSEQLIVHGSRVGTDVAGAQARGNGAGGITMPTNGGANGARIGGVTPELGNVISGNTGHGIVSVGQDVRIQSNRIGTTADGMSDLGNTLNGIDVPTGSTGVVGGQPGAGNLISGNGGDGIGGNDFDGVLKTVSDNRIGTDVGGGAAIPNGGDGIDLLAPGDYDRNLIAGNLGDGMHLNFDGLGGGGAMSISGNVIGRTAGNANALPNAGDGIELAEDFNLLFFGGTLAENVIASNGGHGLRDQSQNAAMDASRNSFFDNGGLAIDRAESGVTPNDERDEVGPTNHPSLTLARNNGTSLAVAGTVEGQKVREEDVLVELYSSPACDPSGRGEGRTWLGSVTVDTDEQGNGTFTTTLPVAVPGGHVLTATTNGEFPVDGVSEFSRCRVVPDVPVPDVSIDDAQVAEGDAGRKTTPLTVRLSRTTTIPVSVDFRVVGETAASGRDFAPSAGRLTIPPGSTTGTIGAVVLGDTNPEGDEFAAVRLDAALGGQLDESSGLVRIIDDDGVPDRLEVTPGDAKVTEGDGAAVTVNVPVRLNRAAGAGETPEVRWETVGLEAGAPGDFTASEGTLAFGAGETEKAVAVQVASDAVQEGEERFLVMLSAPDGVAIVQPTGTVAIADDDAPVVQPPPPPPPDDEGPPPPTGGGGGDVAPLPPADPPAQPPVTTPAPRPPVAPAPPRTAGVTAQNGCLNGPITGLARAAQVSETDLCVEGPAELASRGCLSRGPATHRFKVALKTVRRTRKGRIVVPRRRSLVQRVDFTLNGKRSGSARRRPFFASVKGTLLKPSGVNELRAAVRLRDPIKKTIRRRSLTFRFRTCA